MVSAVGRTWDASGVAFDPATWAACLRVLKPGGHLLAFGGTRTWHRLVCAIEDAGFEIRDSLQWIYGSGFSKGINVSKAIDKAAGAEREISGPRVRVDGKAPGRVSGGKLGAYNDFGDLPTVVTAPATDEAHQWDGWNTTLKPAHEPIVLARKPFPQTVVQNVLTYGTGALNIDGCRTVVTDVKQYRANASGDRGHADNRDRDMDFRLTADSANGTGRWPTNLVLTHSAGCVEHGPCEADCPVGELDRQGGRLKSGANPTRRRSDKSGCR
ncbi:MAG: hypothetical protein JWQ95_1899 [Sphaerisporangium sp.]|nr:hypothetical protein [Sphaerisporangium sp.]